MKNIQELTFKELRAIDGGSVNYRLPITPESGEPTGNPIYPNIPIF